MAPTLTETPASQIKLDLALRPRVLGRVSGAEPGPTLLVIGALHGNEPAGVLGVERVLERLRTSDIPLDRGVFIGLVGNRQALHEGKRYLGADLNRHWLPERVEAALVAPLGSDPAPSDSDPEDRELQELAREIDTAQQGTAEGHRTFLFDLHTFSAPGIAFSPLDDTLANRAFASEQPAPVVLGLEEELSGTLTSWSTSRGIVSTAFESGQHEDPVAIERAEASVWLALGATGLLDTERPEVMAARQRLEMDCEGLPDVVEVKYRHGITPEDGFRMDPGYVNFQSVGASEPLGQDRHGSVTAPLDGLILMPLYQAQGTDGFFLVRAVHPWWLWLSAVVRRVHAERWIHWMPGVRRHGERPETFIVDRRWARFATLELFHLLGFQRQGDEHGRFLVMSRRPHDSWTREKR